MDTARRQREAIEDAKEVGRPERVLATYQQALADTGAVGLERVGVRLSVGDSGHGGDKGDDGEAHGEEASAQGGGEKGVKKEEKREEKRASGERRHEGGFKYHSRRIR